MRPPMMMTSRAVKVITPSPPSWMRPRITTSPNVLQYVAVSTTASPVTVTAEVAVKSASPNGAAPPADRLTGSMRRAVPAAMTPRNARRSWRVGFTLRDGRGRGTGAVFMPRGSRSSSESSQMSGRRAE